MTTSNNVIQLTPDKIIIATHIIDGETQLSAWKRIHGPICDHKASTIRANNEHWYGRIGTDPDRSKFDHLPAWSDERAAAADAAYKSRCELAYKLIREAYPDADFSKAYQIDGFIYVGGPWSESLSTEQFAPPKFRAEECGGVFDGFGVVSDADSGL